MDEGAAPSREPDPPLVFTREAVRELDRRAVERFGVPSIVLMENAALHATLVAVDMLGGRPGCVLVCCGPGNNGGDGLAMARHLTNCGIAAAVLLAAPPDHYSGDAATNLAIVRKMGIPLNVVDRGDPAGSFDECLRLTGRPALVVDALLGTGLDQPVREPLTTMIIRINALAESGVPVLAVDIPSGLDADSGCPLGAAVRATTTVTFVGLKAGFLSLEAQSYVGECVVAGIGAPRALVRELGKPLPAHDGEPQAPRRPPDVAPPGRAVP